VNLTRVLVRLYPVPFRRRWGDALESEAGLAGWRAWPGLVVGLADMWLHPTIWPARDPAERRGRAASTAIAVAAAVWLILHAVAEQNIPLPVQPRRAILNGCVTAMVLGVVLVTPRPRLARPALTALPGMVLRRLAGPGLLAGAVVAAVRFAPDTVVTEPWRPIGLACWWLALGLGAVQTCRIVAALDTVAPHPVRLRAGLCLLIGATAAAGSTIVGYAVSHGRVDPLALVVGAAMALLVSTHSLTLRDLHQVRA
jgi:hypothetical protein